MAARREPVDHHYLSFPRARVLVKWEPWNVGSLRTVSTHIQNSMCELRTYSISARKAPPPRRRESPLPSIFTRRAAYVAILCVTCRRHEAWLLHRGVSHCTSTASGANIPVMG